MPETDLNQMDQVLKRMLDTPPTPHKQANPSKPDGQESQSKSKKRLRRSPSKRGG
jgi:hypothetical protein